MNSRRPSSTPSMPWPAPTGNNPRRKAAPRARRGPQCRANQAPDDVVPFKKKQPAAVKLHENRWRHSQNPRNVSVDPSKQSCEVENKVSLSTYLSYMWIISSRKALETHWFDTFRAFCDKTNRVSCIFPTDAPHSHKHGRSPAPTDHAKPRRISRAARPHETPAKIPAPHGAAQSCAAVRRSTIL